jgi:hypothetical protein
MRTLGVPFFPRGAFFAAVSRFLTLLRSINVLLVTAGFQSVAAGFNPPFASA